MYTWGSVRIYTCVYIFMFVGQITCIINRQERDNIVEYAKGKEN